MGIVNVTPDSFFADARTEDIDQAIERGAHLFSLGADIVDVGGESTRPGAHEITVEEELRRVGPVIRALAPLGRVSVDTQKPEVAELALSSGATVLNDVSASLYAVAGAHGAGYVGMHRLAPSATMQDNPRYSDVVAEVHDFLERIAERAQRAGVTELWLDAGIGFGKTVEHNLALLRATSDLVERAERRHAGVLIGTSRKRFLGALAPTPLEVGDRYEGSIATEAFALASGAAMVRVHDVEAAVMLRELIARPLGEVAA